jgi:hypothetical protein
MILKQKKFVLTFIIVNTLLAIGLKVILVNDYEKKGLLIGRLDLLVGFNVKYDEISKKYKRGLILTPTMYFVQFKDQFVELKINLQEEVVNQSKLYLYSVGTDRDLITKHLRQAVEKVNNLEKPIILKEINNGAIITETVYTKSLGNVIISNKPFYLNNYFVFSVFLLSLLSSICLAIYREKYLNDK